MISKEVLLERMNSRDVPTQELSLQVEGAFYQIHSRKKDIIVAIKEKISDIIPDQCHLFYLSDTTYSLPTQQYSLSFVVK